MKKLWYTCESTYNGEFVQLFANVPDESLESVKAGAHQILVESTTVEPISCCFGKYRDTAMFVKGTSEIEGIVAGYVR